ncbi:MAG: hypothetical protein LHW57_07335 [Candidatus Cloacimonetes bacterium]|nr:hypothetical protein [Candidatus Cloacimonadota bacterium]
MITFRNGLQRALAVSLLLHALLLVLFSMFVIKPVLMPRWYEFELAPPEMADAEVIEETGPEALVPGSQASPAPPATTQAPPAKTQSSQPEPATLKSAETPPADSELLETPALAVKPETPLVRIPNNPLNPLRGIPAGRPGSRELQGGAVDYSVTGGRVRFQLPEGYKHDFGAAGRVVLKFRLDQYARPVQSSIESMEQTGPRYFEEAKQILLQGRFSFTSAPESGREYVLTLNFLL